MKLGKKTAAAAVALCLLLSGGVRVYGKDGEGPDFEEVKRATASEFSETSPISVKEVASRSDLACFAAAQNGEDIWDGWTGDFDFLNRGSADGSASSPFEIRTIAELKALSFLASRGMVLEEADGKGATGDYKGCHFSLKADLDLDGLNWNPIGTGESQEESCGFSGVFDGNGHRISGFRLQKDLPIQGLFGLVTDGRIEDLTAEPEGTVTGQDRVGIIAGKLVNAVIHDCRGEGEIQGGACVGGIAGEAENSILEDCRADVVLNSEEADSLIGGIAGRAENSVIVDGEVSTGDNHTSRIRGKGTVGGIAGVQRNTRIYNVRVTGTIGGAGTRVTGGVTGLFEGGFLKVARFEGSMGNSGLGGQGRKGTFIGSREQGDYFRYGDQVAYLFADSEEKIAANICGSEIPGDNLYQFEDHIGYFHRGDLYFTLVQEGRTREMTEQYFYEELEEGILQVMDRDNGGAFPGELGYTINHFAASDVGRPVRGYLVTIPRIDAAGTAVHEDVAVLEARAAGAYGKKIDQSRRGAVAAGKTVTVYTSPKNTETEKYQLNGVPVYIKGGKKLEMSGGTSGEYVFTMPAEDTEISAVYTKVAASVKTEPASCPISVVQERTGERKDPVKTTRIYNPEGKLIATYINGELEQGTKVQPVYINAVVEEHNDVSDPAVKWSVDDPELIRLLKNDDEDSQGYTRKSAAIEINLDAGFFQNILSRLEREQAESGYSSPIPDVVYGYGGQGGGVAVLTAATRPSASYEGKVRKANCDILVTFQIRDRTEVAVEQASLDREFLEFTVTRKLTGSRSRQNEKIEVTAPQILTAEFRPDFFSVREISWSCSDGSMVGVKSENSRSALVSAVTDSKWIRDIVEADDAIREQDRTARLCGSGERTCTVSVTVEDRLGNRKTAVCTVKVRFVTEDRTGGSSGSGSSSGGSGGSGSGGSSASGSSSGGSTGPGVSGNTSSSGPGVSGISGENQGGGLTGTWIQDESGTWFFMADGGICRQEWAYIKNPYAGEGQPPADWFSFDGEGKMRTGWYKDTAGGLFYLSPVSDGTMGRMVTGWNWIGEYCYYFNPVSDGTRGRLLVSAKTPDGFTVDGQGRWTENGIPQTADEKTDGETGRQMRG